MPKSCASFLPAGTVTSAPIILDPGQPAKLYNANGSSGALNVASITSITVSGTPLVPGVDFAGVIVPPTEGWTVDQPDGDDANPEPDYVLKAWYDYNSDTHVLTPRSESLAALLSLCTATAAGV